MTSTSDRMPSDVTVARRSPALAVAALLLAVVGTAGAAVSFVLGIDAALDSSGSGAGAWPVVFIASLVAVGVAIVLAIIVLVRGGGRVIAVLALLVAAIPTVIIVILRINALA